MKVVPRLRLFATVLSAAAILSAPGFAQITSAPPAPNPASTTADPGESVLRLTPFEVTSSTDTGYQATSTLAGTRIRTDLRDVGSAISVATKEFMRDIGATDSQSLLQYMTNTEVGGVGGNFGGLGDGAALNDNNARLAPHSTTRVRGLDSADNTRDFFLTDFPWDSYNVSRIDIQRGANSILFGNGSGAGIINGAPDAATLGANSTAITARFSQYGGYRGSVNFNRDLLPKELAIRFATLYDKKYYRQDPAYNRDQRYYGALRYEPKFLRKAGAHTSVRMSYENGKIDANRPRTSTLTDMISPWFRTSPQNLVSPTAYNSKGDKLLGVILPITYHGGYNPFTVNLNNAALRLANPADLGISARSPDSINNAGVRANPNVEPWISSGSNNNIFNDWQGGFAAVYNNPNSGTLNQFLNPGTQGYTIRGGLNAAGAVDGTITGLRLPTFDGILPFSAYATAAFGPQFFDGINNNLTSGFIGQQSGIYRDTTLTDSSVFDFYNKLIDGPNKREFSNFDAFNVALDQTFWHDRVGFQLAYDSQVYASGQSNRLGGQPMIGIDIWRYLPAALPDGNGVLQPILNPNFGRPFIGSARGTYSKNTTKRDVFRATPFLTLDFKDLLKQKNLLTNILGRHSITGLYETNKVRTRFLSGPYNAFTQAAATSIFGPSGLTIGGSNSKVAVLTYLGPSLAGASTLSGANISNITAVQNGTTAPALIFNSTYLATAPATGTAYTPPALGLSPSAVGGNATTASENPANYIGWTQSSPITINNVDQNGLLATSAGERREKTQSWALVDQWSLLEHHLVLMGGIRKDRIKTFVPGVDGAGVLNYSGNRPLDGYGVVNFSAPFPYPTEDQIRPQDRFTSDLLKTWSAVLHSPEFINRHLPWGLNASVFYSNSENFRPVTRIDIYGAPVAPPSGKTKDYGVSIGALDGRISFKITRYDTHVTNIDLGDNAGNNVRNRIGDEMRNSLQTAQDIRNHFSGRGYSQSNPFDTTNAASPSGGYAVTPVVHVDGSLINASSPATQADWLKTEENIQAAAKSATDWANANAQAFIKTFNIAPTNTADANSAWNYSIPSGLVVNGDTASRGTEYELFLKPTQNWNITLNASKTFASRLNIGSAVNDYMQKRWAYFTGPGYVPLQNGGDIPYFGGNQGDNAGRVGTEALPRFARGAWGFYQQFKAQEGNAVPELRPWRFNVVNSYNFTRGRLNGLFVGGSYRWQDRNIIGYGYTESSKRLSATTPDLGFLDVTKPFYGPTEAALDLWVGYNRKVFKNVGWRIQVNVSNLGDKAHLVPVNTNPDGSIGSWRIADGQRWEVTNTLKF